MMGFGRTLRNLGSRASAPAMGKAQAVATGANTPKRIVKHTGGGSSAGLNAQKTARLELNGTGYSNPNINGGKSVTRAYPRTNGQPFDPPAHYTRPNPNAKFDTRKPKTSIDR